MNNLKRLGIFLIIAVLLVVVSSGYRGNEILKRAIILGIGVDFSEDGLLVTAEVVSPGNGEEQVGTFSKIVSASGKTIADALQNISEKTGKEASLGQCVLVVLGEEFASQNFGGTTDYFARSDSFKESAAICVCKGTAGELFACGDALLQSVSLSIADQLTGQAKDIALPTCNLLTFARSQRELYKTGFLNYVYYEESVNTNSQNPNQKQVFFRCKQMAAFRENTLVAVLSEEETQGFALLNDEVSGNVFSVTDESQNLVTLRVNTKSVNVSVEENANRNDVSHNGNVEKYNQNVENVILANINNSNKTSINFAERAENFSESETELTVKIKIKLFVKPARADSFGAGGQFTPKSEREISPSGLEQTKQQALELAALFLARQTELEIDLINIHELVRQKHGTTDAVCSFKMKGIKYELTVEVSEK